MHGYTQTSYYKSRSQLFGQATCVVLHVACPNSKS